ncbi:MAG: bifunctional diaminohydroxyphosphoribosylaminopyrimidine deaminase/5-amino-6-(5-phosphoribosylamino)uracil reductase RibD [Gammaproteobacteria bacterium]
MNSSANDDLRYMARALELARRGWYTTHPNPRVGCVIVNNGDIVGEGFHERTGEPHAEIHALQAAGDRARGGTAYVTLEPCSHHGRTPPCADALVAAGVARVVVGMRDPNPRVAGEGLERLQAAGIATRAGVLEAQARALNPGFCKRMESGRPWVRVKLAASLDGRTALASGESQWITGEAARRDVQRLRAQSSAVLTGSGTVLADDPSLNVRLSAAELDHAGEVRQPLRVVLDPRPVMGPEAKILSLPGTTLVYTRPEYAQAADALAAAGAGVVETPGAEDALDLAAVLQDLARREVNEVHVEAGAHLSGAFVQAGLVDELVIYLAPHLMGDGGRGLFHLPLIERMQDRIALRIQDIRAVGDDWRITATPNIKN